jgi:uncharacterized protein YfaS (alpha-2-macroglobulin family)
VSIAQEAYTVLQLDGKDSHTVLRREALDDRFVALLDLGEAQQGFRLAYLVRAAYGGQFVWPGTSVTGLDDASVTGMVKASRTEAKVE